MEQLIYLKECPLIMYVCREIQREVRKKKGQREAGLNQKSSGLALLKSD